MQRRLAWPPVSLLCAALLLACGESQDAGGARRARAPRLLRERHARARDRRRSSRATSPRRSAPASTLEPRTFNAGPEAVEALFSEALDITYIGPNPAINAFAQSERRGDPHRGGRDLGRRGARGRSRRSRRPPTSPARSSRRRSSATRRTWRCAPGSQAQGLSANLEGGGDVAVLPQANAQTLETFRAGEIQGAWVPEPWATRLVLEGGGAVLVDERSLWPDGKFVTTHLVVRTQFLEQHPELVAARAARARARGGLRERGAGAGARDRERRHREARRARRCRRR